VNSDSKPDIIVANSGTTTVSVFLNVGNGTFLAQVTYSVGFGGPAPNAIAVADVNSDNKPDIVVANQGQNTVGVLFNAGNGTFRSVTAYSSGGASAPRGVAVVDVNGDNKPDIITANTGSSTVGVLFNAGNGTFLTVATYSSGAGSVSRGVAVVDVNSDNKPDIIATGTGSTFVGVLINAGNGTFLAVTTYSTGTGSTPRAVAVVDVNSDNKPDIIVANSGSNNTGVLLHC
jgi:predicted Fe-Mo cluster-binding NifX family protein